MLKRLSIVLILLASVFMLGCPPSAVQDSKRYVDDAKKFVNNVQAEYPKISEQIVIACDSKLLHENDCKNFNEVLDPSIVRSLEVLNAAITTYQEAMASYEEAVKAGNEANTQDAWNKVSAALSSVIMILGDATKIYFEVLNIYKNVETLTKK